MDFHVKNAAVTKILEEIAAEYRALLPEEYEAFLAIVDEASHNLQNASAMSAEGNFLNFCKIPQHLFDFINAQMRKRCGIPHFFRDAENFYLFTKVWSDCRIKRKPTNMLILKP